MKKLLKLYTGLIKRLFKKNKKKSDSGISIEADSGTSLPFIRVKRPPYFIQIGFDFGTSFSKCVYRDLYTNRVWIHLPKKNSGKKLPFLDPSIVIYNKSGILSCCNNSELYYPDNGLYHLKIALTKVALCDYKSPVLNSYKKILGIKNEEQLGKLVEICAIYFLACALGEVRNKIRQQFQGFGSDEKDYMAVNLAIPVGEAEIPEINKLFYKVLTKAWLLADNFANRSEIKIAELESMINESENASTPYLYESCYIYPEVSANVQGYVRSRVSGEGIYLFSDIGAGSVDQSVFIFHRHEKTETLAYLCGRVLPLGSSRIEYEAAKKLGNTNINNLEALRIRKENKDFSKELLDACRIIEKELSKETECTLAKAKEKLRVKKEINTIRLIFCGGGFSENPYKRGIMAPFSGPLFQEAIYPDIISIPFPIDIELQESSKNWINRLYVAYGLSFEKSELARFIYPKDIPIPSHDEIWQPKRYELEAPSKDQC